MAGYNLGSVKKSKFQMVIHSGEQNQKMVYISFLLTVGPKAVSSDIS